MLIGHQKIVMDGLRRDSYKLRFARFNFRNDGVHGFYLAHAERTPASADEADDKWPGCQEISRAYRLFILVGKLEVRRGDAGLKCALGSSFFSKFSDDTRMNSLCFGRNVLRDELFALGVDFAQRSRSCFGSRFFERAPFHE